MSNGKKPRLRPTVPEIPAKPTKYNGYEFRSRLEAKWAVFFDALRMSVGLHGLVSRFG